ncbi:MAG: hypothetical protein MJ041_02870 [Acidaminococcaceae bacterium]|nr:hypothetical protein [Acidaminococcaceae bacterium]
MEEVFEKRLYMAKLFDTYRNMLTEKQITSMELYLNEDLSLTEIGDEMGVSRQAVFDLLKRVEVQLQRYEDKLHLL